MPQDKEKELERAAAEQAEQAQPQDTEQTAPSDDEALSEQEKAEGGEASAGTRREKKQFKKLEEKLEKIALEIHKLESEKAELTDRLLRKTAEFENYRKRTDREKGESVSLGADKALVALLPVLDSLSLAAAAPTADESYKKGVELTLQAFRAGLEKLGVQELDALGKPFDPHCHNAVLTEETDAAVPSGTVTKVLQNGYLRGDRVIRPAMVAVAK